MVQFTPFWGRLIWLALYSHSPSFPILSLLYIFFFIGFSPQLSVHQVITFPFQPLNCCKIQLGCQFQQEICPQKPDFRAQEKLAAVNPWHITKFCSSYVRIIAFPLSLCQRYHVGSVRSPTQGLLARPRSLASDLIRCELHTIHQLFNLETEFEDWEF